MKDLFILRHAKSSWSDPFLDDFERPLNKRGKRACVDMWQWFIKQNISPELVLCSPAKRAKDTWKRMKKEQMAFGKKKFEASLYLASPSELLDLIKKVPAKVSSLMLIGHNPGMHELILQLVNTNALQPEQAQSFQQIVYKFPTTGFAHLQFNVSDWVDVAPLTGKLYRIMTPTLLTKQSEQPL